MKGTVLRLALPKCVTFRVFLTCLVVLNYAVVFCFTC